VSQFTIELISRIERDQEAMAPNVEHVVDGAGVNAPNYHSSAEVSHGLIFAQPSPWRLIALLFTLAENLH
jgi:hypothetical protein